MSLEQYTTLIVYILTGVLGLCVGSFLNVVIYRVPNGMSLSNPPSHCPNCNYQLKWYDNIPVLSYLMLGGKCRGCGQKISPRYMLVEIANAIFWLLSVLIFWKQSIVYACISAIVSTVLICIFFIDLERKLIFNRFTITVAVCGVIAIFFDTFTTEVDHVIGFFLGGGLFLLIYFGALLILKKEGMGLGDVKLAFAIGLLLGWQKFIFAMLIASVLGSFVLLILKRVRGDEDGKEYPFGPFIAVGALVAMLVGDYVLNWYITALIF